MKRIFCLATLLFLLLSLCACGEKKEYRDDLSCGELIDRATEQIPVDMGYKSLGGEHIKYNFNDTELDDDHSFSVSASSSDINEVGIFHAADSEATEELSALAEEYLKSYREEKEAFIASYAPKELEKIKNAEVRVFGNYVAYAILSADDGRIFFDTVEKLLRP